MLHQLVSFDVDDYLRDFIALYQLVSICERALEASQLGGQRQDQRSSLQLTCFRLGGVFLG